MNTMPHVEPTGDEVLESASEDTDRGDAGRWEDQNGVTVFAAARPEAVNELKRELAGLEAQVRADGKPFSRSWRIHYARFVFIPEAIDPALGGAGPALMYLADFDGPRRAAALEEIARIAAAEFDRLGPFLVDAVAPTVAGRRQWLQDHVIPDATYYVNTIGRTVRQIRSEARLREAIEDFLDRTDIPSQNPDALRAQIQDFVRDEPSLQWALKPVEDGGWRLRQTLARIAILLVAIPALIAALPALIVWVLAVRWHEKTETGEPPRPEPAHVAGLAEAEDRTLQNQFSALSFAQARLDWLATPVVFLWLARFAVRWNFFDRESIAGVKTIHFARWVFLDGKRRMMFASNYDGSLESYMDDFIDKVAWGLNAVFSNGVGYPRTNWLILDGAWNEGAFKHYIRNHQMVTQVWYSAYPNLSAIKIAENARLRAGLVRTARRTSDEGLAAAVAPRLDPAACRTGQARAGGHARAAGARLQPSRGGMLFPADVRRGRGRAGRREGRPGRAFWPTAT